MSKKYNEMSDDEKLEALERTGRIHGELTGISVDESKVDPPETPVIPKKEEETIVPETPVKVEPAKVDPPADPAPVIEPIKKEAIAPSPSPVVETPVRPLKYKPLHEYTTEKSEWKTKEAAQAARIAELEGLVKVNNAQPDTKATEEKISKFAEKYGFEPEDVKDLLSGIATGVQIPKEVKDQLELLQKEKRETEEKTAFETEFKAVEPSITAAYPEATPAQIAAAKAHLDAVSHTKDFHDKSLDYVLFKNKAEMDEIFKKPEAKPTDPPARKTVEQGRLGHNANTPLSAADFKGQKDFAQLNELEPAIAKQIVTDMDPTTYRSYVAWVGQQESDKGVKVQRDGRTIYLK